MLEFECFPSLKNGEFIGKLVSQNIENGTKSYELELSCDSLFKKKYGNIKLKYSVNCDKNIVVLDTIIPKEILLENCNDGLKTYKGVVISKNNASNDILKIDLLDKLK